MINHDYLQDEATDGAGSGGTGGGGGDAAAAASATAAAAAAAKAAAGGGGSGGDPWYTAHVADPETRAWMANKGWTDIKGMVDSHRSVEKLVGGDANTLLRIPKAGDIEGQRAMYAKLGMPSDAKAYDFGEPPEGTVADEAYQGAMKTAFHKAGVSAEQGKAIAADYNAYVAAVLEAQGKEYANQVALGESQLQNEWRGGYDRQMAVASQTAKMLGFSAEMVDGLELKIGYANTMKFLAGLGTKLGEDSFVTAGGDKKFAGLLTPEEAKVQWEEMKLDQNFTKVLLDRDNPGHKAAKEKQSRLFGIMYPEA